MPDSSPHELLFLNGAFMPLAEGRVSVEDRGFQFADGIYEMIRVASGQPFRLDDHMARAERSASAIGIELEYRAGAMADICRELIARSALNSGTIYIQVTRGAGRRNHLAPAGLRPTTLAYTRPLAPPTPGSFDHGVTLVSRADDRWGHCDAKVIALLPNILAKAEAVRRGADDAVYTGPGGVVYECTSSNIFCVRGGVVFTPPEGPKILSGITRKVILEICEAEGIEAREEPLSVAEFHLADEVFLSSTTRDLVPVLKIDGQKIGEGKSGYLTKRLNLAISSLIDAETVQLSH